MEAVRLAAVPPEARLSGVLRRTVPVTAKAFPPMDAPPRANEVPLATPRVGVVKTMLVAASPLGNVVDIDGTPLPFVPKTALLAVARLPSTPPLS